MTNDDEEFACIAGNKIAVSCSSENYQAMEVCNGESKLSEISRTTDIITGCSDSAAAENVLSCCTELLSEAPNPSSLSDSCNSGEGNKVIDSCESRISVLSNSPSSSLSVNSSLALHDCISVLASSSPPQLGTLLKEVSSASCLDEGASGKTVLHQSDIRSQVLDGFESGSSENPNGRLPGIPCNVSLPITEYIVSVKESRSPNFSEESSCDPASVTVIQNGLNNSYHASPLTFSRKKTAFSSNHLNSSDSLSSTSGNEEPTNEVKTADLDRPCSEGVLVDTDAEDSSECKTGNPSRRTSFEITTGGSGSAASSEFGYDEQPQSLQESSFTADNEDSAMEHEISFAAENESSIMEDDECEETSDVDSEGEWEEVAELPAVENNELSSQPSQEQSSEQQEPADKTLQITVEMPDSKKKSKKAAFDKRDWFRQQMNRYKKETQEHLHKVHLMCLLAHVQHKNRLCCDELLQATALSLLPSERISPSSWSASTLADYVFWFRQVIVIDQKLTENTQDMIATLLLRMGERKVASDHEHTLLFVILSRAIGLPTRLVYSLQPVPFKPPDLVIKPLKSKQEESSGKDSLDSSGQMRSLDEKLRSNLLAKMSKDSNQEEATVRAILDQMTRQTSTEVVENNRLKRKSESTVQLSTLDSKSNCSTSGAGQLRMSRSETCVDNMIKSASERNDEVILIDDDDDKVVTRNKSDYRPLRGGKFARRQCSLQVSYTELSLSEESSGAEDNDLYLDENLVVKKRPSSLPKKSDSKLRTSRSSSMIDSDDWETTLRQTSSSSVVTSMEAVYQRSEVQRIKDTDPSLRPGCDWWAEVYLEKESNWIYVNTVVPVVNQPDEAEMLATRPMSYVLALDNDNCVKDLTKKYAGHWLSCARKLRLSEEWWQQLLTPFQNLDTEKDQLENKQIHDQLMRKSLPATISEYKNHPLYALKRHLLKFEAIYPPNATVFGVIRGEPIYARESVYAMHTKDKWLIEGRCVRDGEIPYKSVHSRLNSSKQKKFCEERKAELYGPWQTDEYTPPRAVNGKVPVNEFGNVSVFKPWMVPGGTVHLPEPRPGLNKVARKLNIDCVPAVIAWDFHSGFNHPIYGGWVVCEEHKDTLLAAWEEGLVENKKKEKAKKKQQIYDNWRKMIKGLLINERIKSRFEEPGVKHRNNTGDSYVDEGIDGSDGNNGEPAVGTDLSWPQNFKSSRISKNLPSVFPFETM